MKKLKKGLLWLKWIGLFLGLFLGVYLFNHLNPWVGLILFIVDLTYIIVSFINKLFKDHED
jgi:ABC-type multidrug transport system permease subunit